MTQPKIIIADDSKLCSHVLRKHIFELGYTLLGEAKDGLEAIKLAQQLQPDLVILDVYMPKMDGYTACNILQDKLGIPTILVTGFTEGSAIDKLVEAAPSGIIIKPINLLQLKSTVELITRTEKSQINMARYKSIVQHAPMLFALVDSDYKYVLVNDTYCKSFLLEEEGIIGRTIAELQGDAIFNDVVRKHIDQALAGKSASYEAWFHFTGTGKRFLSVTYVPFTEKRGGIQNGVVVFSNDITPLKLSEEKLKILSSTDQLTNINNRRNFFEILDKELQRAKRFRHSLLLLSMDIDNFKAINDTYGHPVGDKGLIYVANLLKTTLRQVDTIGRIGGEEFCAILPEVGQAAMLPVLNRIIESFNTHALNVHDREVKITVSIGVAQFPRDSDNIEELVNKADEALYRAKHAGKNRFCIYDAPQAPECGTRADQIPGAAPVPCEPVAHDDMDRPAPRHCGPTIENHM